MLYFANYSGDNDSSIVRETWARLIDQAISRGGIAEACSVIKRVGPRLYPGDGAILPLDIICLQLEKAGLVYVPEFVDNLPCDLDCKCCFIVYYFSRLLSRIPFSFWQEGFGG